jgi:hypothetical protein
MKAIELLEARLAEALQAHDDAAGFVRKAEEVDTDKNLRRLGHAINSAWEVREEVHNARPDLKPNFVEEAEVNYERYEDLSKISQSAYLAEESNDLNKAKDLYLKLKESARQGYFVMVAESGLYRISQAEK